MKSEQKNNSVNIKELSPERIMLVCGSGRNTGKTFLAESIIRHFSKTNLISAIKISMHRHDHPENLQLLISEHGYSIFSDHQISEKDSGRFLSAGAVPSLYIETTDEFLGPALLDAISYCPSDSLIVCESGGLIRVLRPGIIIFVQQPQEMIPDNKKYLRDEADLVVETGMDVHRMVISLIGTTKNVWVTVNHPRII
jgi:hypothetical protein